MSQNRDMGHPGFAHRRFVPRASGQVLGGDLVGGVLGLPEDFEDVPVLSVKTAWMELMPRARGLPARAVV